MKKIHSRKYKHLYVEIFSILFLFGYVFLLYYYIVSSVIFRLLIIVVSLIMLYNFKIYTFNKKEISISCGIKKINYNNINSIVFTLCYFDYQGSLFHYSIRKETIPDIFFRPFIKNNNKIYPASINIYSSEIHFNKDPSFDLISHRNLEETDWISQINEFNFNCYEFDSLKQMLIVSKAIIYVTRSFLYFNKWTINEFAKIIDVSIDRIRLINDDPFVIEQIKKKRYS